MDKRKNISHILIQLLVFATTFILSKIFFQDVYLFEWASSRMFLYTWIVVIILTYLGKYNFSYAITISNTLGLFIGQYLGDWIIERNQSYVSTSMTNEEIYRLNTHHGVFIWIICIIISILLVWIMKILKKK